MHQVFIDNKLVALFVESLDCRNYIEYLYRTKSIDPELTFIQIDNWYLRTGPGMMKPLR